MTQDAKKPASPLARIVGTVRNPVDANQRMDWAKANAHLVSPSTAVGMLPEGCGVALSVVTVDVENETYDVGGKRGLSKTVLEKLAAALGVSWDPYASRRLDDGSDPYYCRWQSVGQYRSFDGQIQTISASKEMDLREGSPQLEALWQRYDAALKDPRKRDRAKSPESQIREMRLHIQAHAESKARLRAIRSLGIRAAYTHDELRKPFVACRVMFTGETDDPMLRRVFAEKTADAFLGGTKALYGTSSQPPVSAPIAPQIASGSIGPRLMAPPPVGSVGLDDDDLALDTHGESTPASRTTRQSDRPAAPKSDRPPASGEQPVGAARSGHTIPGGKSKGVALEDADDRDLAYWSERIGKELEAGTSRSPQRDRELYDAINSEIDARAAGGAL